GHLVREMLVFLQTSSFAERRYSKSAAIKLPYPTDDTRIITRAARQGIRHLYQDGYQYLKSGVGLVDLIDPTYSQNDMFCSGQPARADKLMDTLDAINKRYGRGTVYQAAEGVQKKWAMRQAHKSPAYTTCWREIPVIKTL